MINTFEQMYVDEANNFIKLNKKIIKDLSKDIRIIAGIIETKIGLKDHFQSRLDNHLNSENYLEGKLASKIIKKIQKEVDDLVCIKKTLETARLPYHNGVIEMRRLKYEYIKFPISRKRISDEIYDLCESR